MLTKTKCEKRQKLKNAEWRLSAVDMRERSRSKNDNTRSRGEGESKMPGSSERPSPGMSVRKKRICERSRSKSHYETSNCKKRKRGR